MKVNKFLLEINDKFPRICVFFFFFNENIPIYVESKTINLFRFQKNKKTPFQHQRSFIYLNICSFLNNIVTIANIL